VWIGAAGVFLVISMGVLGGWAYLELRDLERSRIIDCFRIKTMEEDVVPDRRILDDDAGQCARGVGTR